MTDTADVMTLNAHASLASLARDVICQQVLDGHFAPGERLNEVELADSLGISRGPVREAIHRLASEGVLRSVPRRGAFVPTFTADELADLYEVREVLESAAARLASERATDEEIADLRACLEATRGILQAGAEVPYPMDLDLHGKILAASHNPRLVDAATGLHVQIRLARALSAYRPDRARDAYTEHCALLDALARRDGAAASEAMHAHLSQSLVHTTKVLHLDTSTSAASVSTSGEGTSPPHAERAAVSRQSPEEVER